MTKKTLKQLLLLLLTLTAVICLAFAVTACSGGNNSGSTDNSDDTQQQTDGNTDENPDNSGSGGGTTDENLDDSGSTSGDSEGEGSGSTEGEGSTGEDSGSTEATSSEGLEYTLSDDELYYILSGIGTCKDTDIVIPSTYNDLPVSSIGVSAFYNCTSLTSITFPDSVTEIGNYAFAGCYNITSITFGNGLISIGYSAFAGCYRVLSIDIPDSVTNIGGCAFCQYDFEEYQKGNYNAISSIESITIGNGVETIGGCAFGLCVNLISITVNSGNKYFKSIDGNLYSYDEKTLIQYAIGKTDTSFTIPDSVTEIGNYAFWECSSLASVTIPDSVSEIGNYAFWECSSLASAYYNGTASQWASISFYNDCANPLGYAGNLYLDGTLATDITLENISTINSYAFSDCNSLTSVTIGDSVTEIGNYAFCYCYTLVEVYNLSSLTITAGSTDNGYVGYYAKNVYTTTSGSSYLTTQDSYIFYNDDGIYYLVGYSGSDTMLTLPTLTVGGKIVGYSIYRYAFCYNKKITSVIIPDSVTEIGDYAFCGCTSLTSVTIPDSVTSIGDYAFYECGSLTRITIPDGVTEIGSKAFAECNSLTNVTIGDSVITIGDYAFSDCYSLTSVRIGNSVTTIGSRAFYYCYTLVEVYNLSSLTITAGSTDNGYVGYYAKDVYTVASATSNLFTQGDYIFYNDNGTYYLMGYTGSDTVLTLPTLTVGGKIVGYSIYQYAFCFNVKITSITVSDGVTTIGDLAFGCCTSLTSVTIGNSVTSIGDSAFYYCTVLKSIIIGDSVTTISEYAFWFCTSLTSVYITDIVAWCNILFVNELANPLHYAGNLYLDGSLVTNLVIPDSVTSIGDYAFAFCTSLKSVIIGDSVTSISTFAFSSCSSLTSITVNSGNITYKSIDGNLYSYDGKTLILYAMGKTDTSFTIPDGVTTIGEYAFFNCTSLENVIISDSVTEISSFAFRNCTSLINITIGSGVTTIDSSAFYGCTSLTSVYYNGTASEWSAISIDSGNTYLTNAIIYYYAESGSTTVAGNYWYYDNDGNIKIWSVE